MYFLTPCRAANRTVLRVQPYMFTGKTGLLPYDSTRRDEPAVPWRGVTGSIAEFYLPSTWFNFDPASNLSCLYKYLEKHCPKWRLDTGTGSRESCYLEG